MIIEIHRDTFTPTCTLGEMFLDGRLFGQTLEDTDRYLETGGKKIAKETAIPRGRYLVSLNYSTRFRKIMPWIHDVPGFSGVRIHGGTTNKDTEGCPLLGQYRDNQKQIVYECGPINSRLIAELESCQNRGEGVWLIVS